MSRAEALGRLADTIAALPRPAHVAVDGVDAAGKSTLADELALELAERGVSATRVSADDFLRPAPERYRRGRKSPEGYYLDSFDYDAIRAVVEQQSGLAIVDGIFLLRPELDDLWDFRVFVDVREQESIRRGVLRDAAKLGSIDGAERLYRQRYAAGSGSISRPSGPLNVPTSSSITAICAVHSSSGGPQGCSLPEEAPPPSCGSSAESPTRKRPGLSAASAGVQLPIA